MYTHWEVFTKPISLVLEYKRMNSVLSGLILSLLKRFTFEHDQGTTLVLQEIRKNF